MRALCERLLPACASIAVVLCTFVLLLPSARADETKPPTVGMPVKVTDVVLPGSELEVLPLDPHAALLLRITGTYAHGDAHRYDFEYQALEPGEYDLATFLRRKDGTSTADLPKVPVSVRSLLGPGVVKPHAPAPVKAPALGGYELFLIVVAIVWVAGLVALLTVGRKKKREDDARRARPRTLAERLRPLVERARTGELSPRERAQLELGLVAHWRRRLRLEDRRPEDVLVILREHPQAGPLLTSLEDWLHRPDPPDVDVAALLEPYRDLPPDEFDAVSARPAEAWSS